MEKQMDKQERQTQLTTDLAAFGALPLKTAAVGLLKTLGYESDATLEIDGVDDFVATFDPAGKLDEENARLSEWARVAFLFQLTSRDVRQGAQLTFDFSSSSKAYDDAIIESYLFIAVELTGASYSRTALAKITRAVNKLFEMPALLLFRHGETLTLSVINRRLHKRDSTRDVLEKVTLVKDVRLVAPHRAHLEILHDLSLDALHGRHEFDNFVGLHRAWMTTLDSSELNKKFFREIANWYFWATANVTFPDGAGEDEKTRNAISTIRLVTRLIFVWFLKEKGLVPETLFERDKLEDVLTWDDAQGSTYYKAIVQNLFFATLNQEMGEKRGFRRQGRGKARDGNYMAHNVYRYERYFEDAAAGLALFAEIPFLNGGLFECLDRLDADGKAVRIDGFSDRDDNPLVVPDWLFFGEEATVDLSDVYGSAQRRREKVRGLIHIFNRYKFTVDENTPIEEEIALDPELLGKVFENLLAAYNPETETTARKQTGSFYTPREIVDYMVSEALVAYLNTRLTGDDNQEKLRHLLAYNDLPHQFNDDEVTLLIKAIDETKILDPACGSGAFPMGVLHRLVFVLRELDPDNEGWKEQQLAPIRAAIEDSMLIPDSKLREQIVEDLQGKIDDIEEAFERNELDYGRKLFLIENCIYGVDVQPIAVQISKLRFFVSLVVEQIVRDDLPNRGVLPLPNLETKLVAANSLIGVEKPNQLTLRNPLIGEKEKELAEIRRRHFVARTLRTKQKYRLRDEELRREISELLEKDGFPVGTTKQLAQWNPYSQNQYSDFFDPEWMFGVIDGFDITIGNPPYVRADGTETHMSLREFLMADTRYETLWEKWDLYIPFIELGYKLLKPNGVTTMIVSDAYCHAKYAEKSQKWFLENSQILRLDFMSDVKVFDAAVRNMTYLYKRADGAENKPTRRLHVAEFGEVQLLPSARQKLLTHRAFFPEDGDAVIFDVDALTLDNILYISKGMAVHSHEKKAPGEFTLSNLVSFKKTEKHKVPFVEGKYLDRWQAKEHRWLEWGTSRAPKLFSRPTFEEIYTVSEKLISVDMAAGVDRLRVAYDDEQLYHNHSAWSFIPWHSLRGVANRSIKKQTRYKHERPKRPDLPKREQLEENSRRFSIKYLLGVMNSSAARDYLRHNRRSNIHLYPNDWKQLPIPVVSDAQQQKVAQIVDEILGKVKVNANISDLEDRLDAVVNELYGLTDDVVAG